MLKENDVAQISEQFGITKEIVEASAKDGTLGQRIKDVISQKVMYNKEDFESFKKNLTTEAQTNYYNELVENAKKGNIPSELYKPVKGSSYQQLERELSKDYEVTDYSDIKDLISKAIQKQSANGKPNAEIEKQLNDLKSVNLRLKQEAEDAVKTVEQKYKAQIIEREKLDAINRIPLDFSKVKPDELDKVKRNTHNILKSVFDADYQMDYDDKGRLVVKDKDGNVKKNTATLDPVPATDVIIELAKEYNFPLQSPDRGGQGGNSSQNTAGSFTDYNSFLNYCSQKGIMPTSKEGLELWRKSGIK